MNFTEFDDAIDDIAPVYDDYFDEEAELDVHPVKGESLVIRRVMTATVKEEDEDWK